MTDLETRRLSFGAAAAAYAEHRPSYPDAAIEWALAPAPGSDLLDLGAGTGKLTASLTRRPGAHVVAVDPDEAMLGQLRSTIHGIDARVGSAEAIPLADASVDAVLFGQAWHWVDPERAFPEIARVLRPGGVLAAMWNRDDDTVEWVAGYHAAAGIPMRSVRDAQRESAAFPVHPLFGLAESDVFANPVPTTVDGLVATTATHSWALTAEPDDVSARLAAIRDYLSTRPETSTGEFALPLNTLVVRALRK